MSDGRTCCLHQSALDEAFTIATRGGMRLHEADCHLEYARLYVCHRRDEEVKELEEMINEQRSMTNGKFNFV